jgi:hypothetical protein
MPISKEEIIKEWEKHEEKPWYCSKCDTFLSIKDFPECDGTDEFLLSQKKHELVPAGKPVTFEQFSEIMSRWFAGTEKVDKDKFIKLEEQKLTPGDLSFSKDDIPDNLEEVLLEKGGRTFTYL